MRVHNLRVILFYWQAQAELGERRLEASRAKSKLEGTIQAYKDAQQQIRAIEKQMQVKAQAFL